MAVPKRITFDLIRQTIVQVRVSELIGKGRWSKDERLAEELFCLVRHYEPDTKLTYERIMEAILFVKSNPLMGAGQWSKEEHLAEYLYALVRYMSTAEGAAMYSESMKNAAASKAPKTPRPAAVGTTTPGTVIPDGAGIVGT